MSSRVTYSDYSETSLAVEALWEHGTGIHRFHEPSVAEEAQRGMTREEASTLVNYAIDQLVAHEPILLELNVTERALSHHLACYMAARVPAPLSVDCEYNRHFDDPKRLNLPHRNSLDREIRATTVFPDIIVHERNSDNRNLLVLEIKKPGEDIAYDEIKLR